ncbi:MAG: hypothetical protein H6620_05760 [Halobacteriovoraceae bacterium]|nr:hypothetical protein [Halobacteriovoraceae bacterium]
MKKISNASIVGPLFDEPTIAKQIKNDDFVIFVDGGCHALDSLSKSPKNCLVIGDGDSNQGGLEIFDILLGKEKDRSDFFHALKHLPNSIVNIQLYGFLGGRLDHTLMNLGEIHHYLYENSNVERMTLYQKDTIVLQAISKPTNFKWNGEFSVVSLADQHISLEGDIKYPLKNEYIKAMSSRGLSNIAYGNFSVTASLPCFVFYTNTVHPLTKHS